MQRCLILAQLAEGFVAPNPMVGCVIVYEGKIVAEGYHKVFGGSHAEVNAFNSLPNEVPIKECDVYVSLEPCSHHGKTPPCADLIISKHPRKVYIGMLDPNPKVAGRGIAKINDAGIDIEIGMLQSECINLNKKFFCYHSKNRPFVTLKWAETADRFIGRLPNDNDLPKQISSKLNRPFVHKLRATNQAILVGAATLKADNPKLTTRFWEGPSPLKVIISKTLSIDEPGFNLKEGKTLILNGIMNKMEQNIEYIKIADFSTKTILNTLYNKGIQSVLIEGGAATIQIFIDENCWDEAIVLKSSTNWSSGIKSPILIQQPEKIENRFEDEIVYYYN